MRPKSIGFLMAGDRSYPSHRAFHDELAKHGFRQGDHLRIEDRFGEGDQDRLPRLADELVATGIDALCVVGAVTFFAARRHADRLPLLFSVVLDPVNAGLVSAGPQLLVPEPMMKVPSTFGARLRRRFRCTVSMLMKGEDSAQQIVFLGTGSASGLRATRADDFS